MNITVKTLGHTPYRCLKVCPTTNHMMDFFSLLVVEQLGKNSFNQHIVQRLKIRLALLGMPAVPFQSLASILPPTHTDNAHVHSCVCIYKYLCMRISHKFENSMWRTTGVVFSGVLELAR